MVAEIDALCGASYGEVTRDGPSAATGCATGIRHPGGHHRPGHRQAPPRQLPPGLSLGAPPASDARRRSPFGRVFDISDHRVRLRLEVFRVGACEALTTGVAEVDPERGAKGTATSVDRWLARSDRATFGENVAVL